MGRGKNYLVRNNEAQKLQLTANAAKKTAEEAQKIADEAQKSADEAQKVANEAQKAKFPSNLTTSSYSIPYHLIRFQKEVHAVSSYKEHCQILTSGVL